MKERPIIFSTPMVKAILEGRKTMTRRIFRNPYHPSLCAEPCDCSPTEGLIEVEFQNDLIAFNAKLIEKMKNDRRWIHCPYGAPGDRFWVRETFFHTGSEEYLNKLTRKPYFYKATISDLDRLSIEEFMLEHGIKWKPSLYMPKDAHRICLEITKIRFERLSDISENDAKLEGSCSSDEDLSMDQRMGNYNNPSNRVYGDIRLGFKRLWKSIYGDDSWDANPWVWVIEFEKIV